MMKDKNKKRIREYILCFAVMFLLSFMFIIFGPAEIFITNYDEFDFVYGDFSTKLACYGVLFAIVSSAVLILLPGFIRNLLIALVSAASIAGYIQVMFLNKKLDLLGVNPEGYVVDKSASLVSGIVWIVILAVFVIGIIKKEDIFRKFIGYISVCLLLIQGVAFVSLFVTAPKAAFERPSEGEWYLSGEKQYTVSADKNIIVFVLDYFSNQYLEYTYASNKYPDLFDGLKDFTFYNNVDCAYYGTFPSISHMFTAQEVNPDIPINEWIRNIWTDDKVSSFYQNLQEKNYEVNFYTSDLNMVCAGCDREVLLGKFDNLVNSEQNLVVDYDKLDRTMMKLSAFRLLPDILKSNVYVQLDEYEDIVQSRDNNVVHKNYLFYEGLLDRGLVLEEGKNCFVIQHLLGTHLFTTGADGHYKEDSTRDETVKGCFVMVEEYINQLKRLGVYDDATIIITADHGDYDDSQVVYFMKNPGEQHEKMAMRTAPISLCDLLPTIGKAAGIPYEQLGRAVSEVGEDEKRERAVWVRHYDEAYPKVHSCYSDAVYGNENVYYEYRYIGNLYDLLDQYELGPTRIIKMKDCFF